MTEGVSRQETPGAQEESRGARGVPPHASNSEVDHEAEDLFRDLDEEGPPEAGSGSGRSPGAHPDLDTADGERSEISSLVERLCRVDMCEVFSPPRVGLEAAKFWPEGGGRHGPHHGLELQQ